MLAEALSELSVKYRTVLHLYYYEGLTAEEIAQIQQVPAGTVRMQLSRGRKMLKEKLEGGMTDGRTVTEIVSDHE